MWESFKLNRSLGRAPSWEALKWYHHRSGDQYRARLCHNRHVRRILRNGVAVVGGFAELGTRAY